MKNTAKKQLPLQKALEKLNARLEQQKTHLGKKDWTDLESLNGEGMIRKCEAVIKDLKAVPGLVEAYVKKRQTRWNAPFKKSREKFVSEEDLKRVFPGTFNKRDPVL